MARGEGSGGGEEAAWLELIARYDAPAPASGDDVPWPEREDLAGPVRVSPADALPDAASITGAVPPSEAGPVPEAPPEAPSLADAPFPDTLSLPVDKARPVRPAAGFGPGSGPRDAPIPEHPADEHYIPPPAPPLPRLAPVTKGAWVALFGGPLYLIIATVVGWTVSGLAAFVAVAAFVGGFAVLVLRMDSGPPRDRGPDDGAVV